MTLHQAQQRYHELERITRESFENDACGRLSKHQKNESSEQEKY